MVREPRACRATRGMWGVRDGSVRLVFTPYCRDNGVQKRHKLCISSQCTEREEKPRACKVRCEGFDRGGRACLVYDGVHTLSAWAAWVVCVCGCCSIQSCGSLGPREGHIRFGRGERWGGRAERGLRGAVVSQARFFESILVAGPLQISPPGLYSSPTICAVLRRALPPLPRR